MPEGSVSESTVPHELTQALEAWTDGEDVGPLARWVEEELGPGDVGLPRRLPVPKWWPCLAAIDRAIPTGSPPLPGLTEARILSWVRLALRTTTSRGSALFEPAGARRGRAQTIAAWVERLGDPGWSAWARRWFPSDDRRAGTTLLPLPSSAESTAAFAVLRSDWDREADVLAIDHRQPAATSKLHLIGRGRSLLRGAWGDPSGYADAPPAPVCWQPGAYGDLFEWSFSTPGDPTRVTRTAALLRARRLAVLAETWEGEAPPAALRLAVDPQLRAEPATSPGSVRLMAGPRNVAQVTALVPDDAGGIELDGTDLVLRASGPRSRLCRGVVVSWDPARNRQAILVRRLTITEERRVLGPDEAVAWRIGWGRRESLVVYRSLIAPGNRAFLGHPTTARLVLGTFDSDGQLRPLVKRD